jgi:hypothetical protein
MAAVNNRRVALGALAGGVVWTAWSVLLNGFVIGRQYLAAESSGALFKQPRYPFFLAYWITTLFLLSYAVAWLYASVRATRGAGPGTALAVGLLVGFAAAFPVNLTVATWIPLSRIFPLFWMLDLWVGAMLASVMAGFVYKDAA